MTASFGIILTTPGPGQGNGARNPVTITDAQYNQGNAALLGSVFLGANAPVPLPHWIRINLGGVVADGSRKAREHTTGRSGRS
jgi:hypothetical protein